MISLLTMLQPILSFVVSKRYYLILALACFVAGCKLGCASGDIFNDDVTPKHTYGWYCDPEKVEETLRTFDRPYFSDAGRNLMQATDDKDAFLWRAIEQITKAPIKAHDQDGTGCCVGEGYSLGVEVMYAVDIATNRRPYEWKSISASAVYALSREVGGMLGGGDGSYGAAAAKALMQMGAISCEEAKDDNTTGSPHAQVARKWGKTGLPAELKLFAAKHKVKTASLVRTPEEAKAALVNGYPIPICSNVGFEPTRRDADGFCKPGGSWPHCMCLVGYRADMRAFLVMNSWGENSPTGPKTLDQPNCSFWITWDACARILKAGDSFALSSFEGYPARNLDFFVMAPRKDRSNDALLASLLALSLDRNRR